MAGMAEVYSVRAVMPPIQVALYAVYEPVSDRVDVGHVGFSSGQLYVVWAGRVVADVGHGWGLMGIS
jgi:hypothetical protein